MDLKTAISILEKEFPDKKIIGNPAKYRGKYTFSMVAKDFDEGTPNWDATITAIDINSGEVSQFNAFGEPDFLTEATPIK